MPFLPCLNTSTIRPASLVDKINAAAQAGFRAIEPWNDDVDTYLKQGGTWEALKGLLRERGLTVEERAVLPCLEPGRADLIIPGTAIVMATLDQIGIDELRVSEYGLREGVLVDAIEGHHGSRPGAAP